jgi:hypothetical protein
MAPEQLILLALFLIAGFVNLVIRWLRERQQARQAPGPAETPASAQPVELIVRRAPVAVPLDTTVAPRPALPRPVQGPAMPVIGGPAGLRRAIVVMTLLGPPRALEHDPTTAPGVRR